MEPDAARAVRRCRRRAARREKQEGLGSGFIVDKSGIVLTNNHVVAGADEVIVRLRRQPPLRRTRAGQRPADRRRGRAASTSRPPTCRPVTLGDSDRVRVGDYVLAIGNPLGLGQTVTMGIVSAKNRVIGEKLGDIDPRYEDFIQTDAAINQGNSGGPLFNFRGEVIGINAAIINPGMAMNVGFAIPINLARQIADQIRQVGHVSRAASSASAARTSRPSARTELRVPYVAGRADQRGRAGDAGRRGRAAPERRRRRVRGQGDRRLPASGRRRRAAAAGREGQAGAVAPGQARRGGGDAGRAGRRRGRRSPCWASSCAAAGSARAGGARARGRGRAWSSPPSTRAAPPAACWRRATCCSRSTAARSRWRGSRRLDARLQRGAHATLVIQRGADRFALRL